MIIHTVYRPQEHIDHLEDWLKYHTYIGVEHFYLYDNGESIGYGKNKHGKEWDRINHTSSSQGITRYGFKVKYNIEQSRNIESNIIKNYPVTKINWSPKQENDIVYGYNDSVLHLLDRVKTGLCAFIDIDEYIVKKEEFTPSRMYQKRFKDYHYFNSIFECKESIGEYDLPELGPKCIINLKDIKIDNETLYPNTMHFFGINLPTSKSHFNHYNFNKVAYRSLSKLNPNIPRYSNIYFKIKDPFEGSIINLKNLK